MITAEHTLLDNYPHITIVVKTKRRTGLTDQQNISVFNHSQKLIIIIKRKLRVLLY